MGKILSAVQIDAWVAEQRRNGLRIGYTCGAFDILHAGHVDYLRRARFLCDLLLVAVNSDRSIRSYKNPFRPINPEEQRIGVVSALDCVDAATLLDARRPVDQLQRWRPDLYIKGGDYHIPQLRSATTVESYGGRVVIIPVFVHTSTTSIVERIKDLAAHAEPEPAPESGRQRLLLLDRDGTLIRDVPYLSQPERVELLPGVGESLARLQGCGFRLVIITNQQGIGLGYSDTDRFLSVNQALFRKLSAYGVRISRVYFCPHSLADSCECRKPSPLLVRRALEYFSADPGDCYFIGDRPDDAEAAIGAGCTPVLVRGGDAMEGVYRVGDFAAAAAWIERLEQERNSLVSC